MAFSDLPQDALRAVAGHLSSAEDRRAARLVCAGLNRAVVDNMCRMDCRMLMRYPDACPVSSRVCVCVANLNLVFRRLETGPQTAVSRERALALACLVGMPYTSPAVAAAVAASTAPPKHEDGGAGLGGRGLGGRGGAGRRGIVVEWDPRSYLGGWGCVAAGWSLSELSISGPLSGQLDAVRVLAPEIGLLSVVAGPSSSTKRASAMAMALLLASPAVPAAQPPASQASRLSELHLTLAGWPSSSVFEAIAASGSLRRLSLHSSAATGPHLACCRHAHRLAGCPGLEHLSLRGLGVGSTEDLCAAVKRNAPGRGLQATLRSLHIAPSSRTRGANATAGGVDSIGAVCRAFPMLEELRCEQLGCAADDVRDLAAMARLRKLTIVAAVDIADSAGTTPAQAFPELTHLAVTSSEATGLAWVSWAGRLEHLDLSCNNLDAVPAISPCARLAHVDLSWNSIGCSAAHSIVGSPAFSRLESIDISSNDLLDYGAVYLLGAIGKRQPPRGVPGAGAGAGAGALVLPRLRLVTIDHNRMSASGIRWLEREIAERLAPLGVRAVIGSKSRS